MQQKTRSPGSEQTLIRMRQKCVAQAAAAPGCSTARMTTTRRAKRHHAGVLFGLKRACRARRALLVRECLRLIVQPDQRGHAAGLVIAAIGIKQLTLRDRAEIAADDPRHAERP